MGIISWIKNKYNDHLFQKAQHLSLDGKTGQAIEILSKILDAHPDAPRELLSLYHSLIKHGDFSKITNVAELYGNHSSLKSECIEFSKELGQGNNSKLIIDYNQSLYDKGICELQSPFLNIATKYILNNKLISYLTSLTRNTSLLKSLSESLVQNIKDIYRSDSSLKECKRLCNLILPYISSKEFYEVYSDIRFDTIACEDITTDSIKLLDALFKDIKNNYKLSEATIRKLTDKGLALAQSLFSENKFIGALLLSQRLMDYYAKACQIYSDSALKLYSSSNNKSDLVVTEILYKSLGSDNHILVSSLEPFIPYSTHREKYVSVVISELTRLSNSDKDKAEELFNRAWKLAPDIRYISCVLTNNSDDCKIHFAKFILSNCEIILSDNFILSSYISELGKLNNTEFVVSTLEALMDKGKMVGFEYEKQILRLAQGASSKSRKRIEIIDRGISRKQTQQLYAQKAIYCNDYIESGRYDLTYATDSANSLIGHDALAEVLIVKILLDDAKVTETIDVIEDKLRKAIAIKETHNQLFNDRAYDAILPNIVNDICNLAKKLYNTEPNRAIALLYLLRDNKLSWYDTYANLYLGSIQQQAIIEETALKLFTIIKEGEEIKSTVKESLWSKYVEITLSINKAKAIDDAIFRLESLQTQINSNCDTQNRNTLIKNVENSICELFLLRAKQHEKDKSYIKAIKDYTSILEVSGRSYSDIKARIYICKLKNGKSLLNADKEEIENLLNTSKDKPYQKDLAYRWCIYLISNGQLEQAEEINNRILGIDNEITQICREERIISQQKILDGLNEQIAKLNNSELTAQEAMAFGQSLSNTLDEIDFIVQISLQKSNILREAIRVYAIEKYYKQEDFVQSLKGLKVQDSEYLSEPVALRNIAIMCLRAAESGQITNANYQELLAIWATAIYQQRLFVQSLDYTSWDDPYTFTLCEALGQLDNGDDELPDNINYNDESENGVVSIREVQKALICRMEAALNNNSVYQQFFSSQLEAMDKLAEQNLDEKCVLVAPYLLTISNTYKNNVTNALTIEEKAHYDNWETILEVGNMYGLSNGYFGRYASAKEALQIAIDSIERKSQVLTAFTASHIDPIKEFSGHKSSLISAVTTALNNEISQNVDYLRLNTDFSQVVKVIADSTLSFIFSNYINQQIVKSLNEKTITLGQGSPILFEIYEFCKCNPHLKRNIENIIEALIHNYVTNGDDDNLTVLNNVLSSTREFDTNIVKALKGGDGVPEEMLVLLFLSNEARFNFLKNRIGSKSRAIQNQFNATMIKISALKIQLELNQIVEQVNNNSMNKYDALQKLYNIYNSNKDNDRVCENLATLIPMCVMEYIIPNKYGKSKVESVLDALKNNMTATFRSHNAGIGEAYNLVWRQLPYDARNAIENTPWTLNEQGKALKKGLDYLKALK